MAREINRLTTAFIRKAKPGMHPDGGGLYLQVTPSRTTEGQLNKSWLFRFVKAGSERQMGLGSLKSYTLSDAREAARQCRQLLDAGEDPIAARDALKEAKTKAAAAQSRTFEVASMAYMAVHEAGWRNAVHRRQWTQTLKDYVNPVIGKLPVDAITTDHVMKILSPIWATKSETAARVRGRIEKILDAEKVSGHRSGENPARWQEHLAHLLPARKKVHKGRKHPALPWEQVPEFMSQLRTMAGIAPRALEFAILCASRAGEVRGAQWSEIDLDRALWTVPAERMKGHVEHTAPLSSRAMEILADMSAIRLGDTVFPGDFGDEAAAESSLRAVLARMNEQRCKASLPPWVDPKQDGREVSPHGFRSSFKDWCDECEDNAFPSWLSEAALAHAVGNKTEAAYKRGLAIQKRRKLMEAWAAYCSGEAAKEDAAPLAAE